MCTVPDSSGPIVILRGIFLMQALLSTAILAALAVSAPAPAATSHSAAALRAQGRIGTHGASGRPGSAPHNPVAASWSAASVN